MTLLKEATNYDLVMELRSRGYITDLLWSRDDVDQNLEWVNDNREDHEKIRELDDNEKDDILKSLNFGYYTERINSEIYDKIINDYGND